MTKVENETLSDLDFDYAVPCEWRKGCTLPATVVTQVICCGKKTFLNEECLFQYRKYVEEAWTRGASMVCHRCGAEHKVGVFPIKVVGTV